MSNDVRRCALEEAELADLEKEREAADSLFATREALAHLARVATLGELTASIAHEVAQPLTAITASAAACQRWLQAGKLAEAAEAAARIRTEAARATEVIQRIRSLFRKQGAEKVTLDLNEVTAEVVALTQAEMTRVGITFDVQLGEEVPSVHGNRVQLQQVVMNLVLNAIQAVQDVVGRGRSIAVATSLTADGRVRILVRDSGYGVPAENESSIFQPFFSTKAEGTGVGLSISRSIVDSHQGRLWYAANDGPGATFGFDLPPRYQGIVDPGVAPVQHHPHDVARVSGLRRR